MSDTWRIGQMYEWAVYFTASGRSHVFRNVIAKSPVAAITSLDQWIPDHAIGVSCQLVRQCEYLWEQSCPYHEVNES
jgi:hypothetical protein